MRTPGFRYEVREHIAFCLSCVGRSLPPEQHAALLLSEMFDFKDREGAEILGVTEPTFRHRLQEARAEMVKTFDGLCALVSKQGACYQCNILREAAPRRRRGDAVRPIGKSNQTAEERLQVRLQIARDAPLEAGNSRLLHEVIFRLMNRMFDGDDRRGSQLPPDQNRDRQGADHVA
jgi:RNA polymerase sigma-70 factor (ECF subfamily)